MSLPEIRGTGRLLTNPRTGTGKNDKPWTSALILFPVWRKSDDRGWEEGEGAVASVMTFQDCAEHLATYSKGDTVGVHGTCRPAVYRDKPQLAVTATRIWRPEKPTK